MAKKGAEGAAARAALLRAPPSRSAVLVQAYSSI